MSNASHMNSLLKKFLATSKLAEIIQRIHKSELGNKDFKSTFALTMRDLVWAIKSDVESLARQTRNVLAKKEAVDELVMSFDEYISTMILMMAVGFLLGTIFCRILRSN